MKNVLILGKASYIGESLYSWLLNYPDKYKVDIISTVNDRWREADFSLYDAIVDFAGIAHINHITKDMEGMFYSVNRDLTIELGKHAKEQGVRHFIYFSSMNVYGDRGGVVSDRNKIGPTSFYGDSKLQGELGLQKLEDKDFAVAYVRPPFVYGKGCKGNYNTVSKIAKIMPIFPNYKNRKSMIYIDNLCEFIRLVIDNECGGVFTPQNRELVSTSDLVKEIAKYSNRTIKFTRIFNWFISAGNKCSRKISRAFGDDCYSLELSNYWDFRYCVIDFEESIKRCN